MSERAERAAHDARGAMPPLLRLVGWAYGLYYVVGGLWPVLHMPSFEAITGDKVDEWLVRCIGAMLVVIGLAVIAALRRQRMPGELAALAVGIALVLAAIDVIYWAAGVLRWVYLLDAAAELALVAGWAIAWRERDHGDMSAP